MYFREENVKEWASLSGIPDCGSWGAGGGWWLECLPRAPQMTAESPLSGHKGLLYARLQGGHGGYRNKSDAVYDRSSFREEGSKERPALTSPRPPTQVYR